MINEDNFKSLLKYLNFDEKANTFTKNFEDNGNYLKVNFTLKQIEYPEISGLIVNERQTCNFSQSENQVVFECVHELLEKGYEPKHIELEPKWKVGRGASGGRADILVKDKTNKPLLLIECKTYGNEFNKAWKDTQDDGGQLFSYAQQISETEWLSLYTSEYNEKENNLNRAYYLITHKDNEKILEQDKNLLSFKKATNVKNRYEVWKDTYKLEYMQTGVFEDNIQAYQIGKNKYTLENDTRPIISGDKKGKYHKFRTILRKYNIARKETAFEVLVNLFLAKLVDEEENKTDLNFYWKGVAYDDYYSLMDRLQQLYQIGMLKFLNDEIMYISDDKIEKAFWTVKNKRNATKKTIQDYFRDLKYYSNNAFSFVNVHNKRLFEKNAKVLVEIIQMWQELRLKTDVQNQFLGDMFEYFLDNGIKQSEGQFFTPIPICKFIVMSLPLEKSVELSSEPLRTIDFACGSGHFLNEYAHQIKPYIEKYKSIEFAKYLENTFGIEKEDRLAKVAKVSAYMYGQGIIKILEEDALDDIKDINPESFNFLIANPPFAVEGFLTNLSEKQRAKYELSEITGLNSNTNNVQCFFIERAKQIMAPGGVVGIIVPSSVLSNSDATHVATREIILKFFDIVSIAELPSGTFGKTGTNTVVLFLRRKDRKPEPADHYQNRVEDYFDINLSEILEGNSSNKDLEEYQDLGLIKKYCEHNELPFKEYIKLFGITPETFHLLDELLKTEMFKDYKSDFDGKTEIKKLITSNNFKKLNKEQQTLELNKRFIEFILNIEKDKLFYFMLAADNQQKVLIIKSPTETKEQKQFLGYEWSGSKGSEGIIYNGGETVSNINTPLFDPNNTYNEEKINFLILQNFLGERPKTENLQENCTYANLADMLDFSRKDFNKAFSLTPKKNLNVPTKWEVTRLGEIVDTLNGLWTGKNEPYKRVTVIRNTNFTKDGKINLEDVAIIDVEENQYKTRKLNFGDIIIEKSGGSETQAIGRVVYFDRVEGDYSYSNFTNRLRLKTDNLLSKYLHLFLNYFYQIGNTFYLQNGLGGLKNLDFEKYLSIKIPLPPLEVQQKIVDECEAIDKNVDRANSSIEKAKKEIEEKVGKWFSSGYEIKKIKDVSNEIFAGGDKPKNFSEIKNDIFSIPVFSNGSQSEGLFGYTDVADQRVEIPSVTVSARGTLGYTVVRNELYLPIVRLIVINPNIKIINQFYLVHYMNYKGVVNTGANIPQLTVPNIKEMEIPVPPLEVQEQLVAEIEKLEAEIAAAKEIVVSAPTQKQAVMERWL